MCIYRNGSGDVAAPRGIFLAAPRSCVNSSFMHAMSANPFSVPLPAVRGGIGCCFLAHGTGWLRYASQNTGDSRCTLLFISSLETPIVKR